MKTIRLQEVAKKKHGPYLFRDAVKTERQRVNPTWRWDPESSAVPTVHRVIAVHWCAPIDIDLHQPSSSKWLDSKDLLGFDGFEVLDTLPEFRASEPRRSQTCRFHVFWLQDLLDPFPRNIGLWFPSQSPAQTVILERPSHHQSSQTFLNLRQLRHLQSSTGAKWPVWETLSTSNHVTPFQFQISGMVFFPPAKLRTNQN